MKIIDLDVEDLNEVGVAMLSLIQINAKVESGNHVYDMCFQTSETMDYGAISTDLKIHEVYDRDTGEEIDDYDEIRDIIDAVCEKAQEVYDEYIQKNYSEAEPAPGIDARSEVNEVKSLNKIKDARLATGLTQKQMSDILGIPTRTIENWESGKRSPVPWAERLLVAELERLAENLKN